MLKRYIYVSMLVILSCSLIYSQNVKKTGGFARIQSMGANPFIIDPFFETVNPAWGSEYDHFLFADIGSTVGAFSPGGVGQFVSVNFDVGNNLTFGAILTRNDFNGTSIALVDPATRIGTLAGLAGFPAISGGVVTTLNGLPGVPGGAVIAMDNNLELMGTLKFGRTTFGLGIAYASTTNETAAGGGTTDLNVGSASQFGINLGLLSNLTGSIKLDAGASFMFPGATYEPAVGNASDASQTIIGINARLFWRLSSRFTFVPVISFATISGSAESGAGTTTTSFDLPSLTAFTLGAGINYTVGDFLLAGGPSLTSATITQPSTGTNPEISYSAFIFPTWNLGIEWNLLDWLVGRFGYVAATASVSGDNVVGTPQGPTVVETSRTVFLPSQRGVTLGIGFRFGDFSLDATVNEDVLRQGFNNIGGGGASFAYLSASYAIPQ